MSHLKKNVLFTAEKYFNSIDLLSKHLRLYEGIFCPIFIKQGESIYSNRGWPSIEADLLLNYLNLLDLEHSLQFAA